MNVDIDIRSRCSDEELVELLGDASAVIQPSLEEGFGLTVVEALLANVPVCCTAGTAMADAALGRATLFDGNDVEDMARAIDVAAGRVLADDAWESYLAELSPPSPAQFAAEVIRALDDVS
jgi:glycosyltransferase involved in cell wall biosynthesis